MTIQEYSARADALSARKREYQAPFWSRYLEVLPEERTAALQLLRAGLVPSIARYEAGWDELLLALHGPVPDLVTKVYQGGGKWLTRRQVWIGGYCSGEWSESSDA